MNKDNKPLIIIAWGLTIAFGLAGLGLLLKWTLPALGAMFGIATTIIAGGIATTTFSSWVIPAASAGLAVAGGATGLFLLRKVVQEAKKKPFEWILPIFAIVSALVIDICKELYQTDDPFKRIIYGAMVSGIFLSGGILWTQKKAKLKGISTKIISVILFLIPPFLIYFHYCQKENRNLLNGFQDMPPDIWAPIAFLIALLFFITILSWIFKGED